MNKETEKLFLDLWDGFPDDTMSEHEIKKYIKSETVLEELIKANFLFKDTYREKNDIETRWYGLGGNGLAFVLAIESQKVTVSQAKLANFLGGVSLVAFGASVVTFPLGEKTTNFIIGIALQIFGVFFIFFGPKNADLFQTEEQRNKKDIWSEKSPIVGYSKKTFKKFSEIISPNILKLIVGIVILLVLDVILEVRFNVDVKNLVFFGFLDLKVVFSIMIAFLVGEIYLIRKKQYKSEWDFWFELLELIIVSGIAIEFISFVLITAEVVLRAAGLGAMFH